MLLASDILGSSRVHVNPQVEKFIVDTKTSEVSKDYDLCLILRALSLCLLFLYDLDGSCRVILLWLVGYLEIEGVT